MSRIGNQPIPVPSGVDIDIKSNDVTVKGPKGTLTRTFHEDMSISLENGTVLVGDREELTCKTEKCRFKKGSRNL